MQGEQVKTKRICARWDAPLEQQEATCRLELQIPARETAASLFPVTR
jgi:hypothetical protein